MIEGIAGVTIWSTNPLQLSAFYKDVLELPVRSLRPNFVSFEFGRIRLNIGLHSEVTNKASDPFRSMINLDVRDIKMTYACLVTKGVEFIRTPEQEHWGGWVATFVDPDGNILQLLQQPH